MIPLWTDSLQTSNLCRELVKYKKGCTGRCKYLTCDLKCAELCQCFGLCASGKSCLIYCILYWFWKNSTTYYKDVSRTITTYKVEHCVKNAEIRAFCNLYFPVFGQNRKFCPNTGKYRYDSVHIRENTDSRNPVFGHISRSGVLGDIS